MLVLLLTCASRDVTAGVATSNRFLVFEQRLLRVNVSLTENFFAIRA